MAGKRQRLSGQDLEGEHRIFSVDAVGRGIVRVGEQQVLVPGAYKGALVRLHLTHRGRHGVHHAKMTELIEASASRVQSPCPHFLDCGGCDLLHIHPEEQHQYKRRAVAAALGVELEQVEPIEHAEFHFDYRAYAKFVVGADGTLGSYRRRSHSVAPMDECVVHAPAIAAAHDLVQTRLKSGDRADIRYVVMRASIADERTILTLVCTNPRAGLYRALGQELGAAPFIAAVDFHHNDQPGNAIFGEAPITRLYDDGKELSETIGPLRLQLKSSAFSQVNPAMAERLYAHVCAELSEAPTVDGTEGDMLVDLFAGSGGIGLSLLLANPRARVVAVEALAAANRAARATAETHGVSDRHETIDQNVEEYLQAQTTLPGWVVVNPPRKGLGAGVTAELLRLSPPGIVYVSCSPETLAKDVAELEAGGYKKARIVPFDMFPNTAQVETVVTLTRRPEQTA